MVEETQILTILKTEEDIQYFTYANPLNNDYLAVDHPLTVVVFLNETEARVFEHKSPTMQKMIGHWLSFSEVEAIAIKRTSGRWMIWMP